MNAKMPMTHAGQQPAGGEPSRFYTYLAKTLEAYDFSFVFKFLYN
jgi:hypothetical protein